LILAFGALFSQKQNLVESFTSANSKWENMLEHSMCPRL